MTSCFGCGKNMAVVTIWNIRPKLIRNSCETRSAIISTKNCQIVLKILTQRDSDTAVLCAKLQNDLTIKSLVTGKRDLGRFKMRFRFISYIAQPRLTHKLTNNAKAKSPGRQMLIEKVFVRKGTVNNTLSFNWRWLCHRMHCSIHIHQGLPVKQ